MLSKLKIAHKLYVVGIVQLLIIAVIGFVSVTQMSKIGAELVDIAEKDIPLTNKLTLLTEHQLEGAILFEQALFKAVLANNGSQSAKTEFDGLRTKIDLLTNKVNKEIMDVTYFIKKSLDKVTSEKTKTEFGKLLIGLSEIGNDYKKLKVEIETVLDVAARGEILSKLSMIKNVEKHQEDIDHNLIALLNDVQEFTLNSALQAEQDEKEGLVLIVTMLLMALVFGMIIPFVISRSIAKPIVHLHERLHEIAQGDGDLTQILTVTSNDETADLAHTFNDFIASLRNTIVQVKASADELANSSEIAVRIMDKTVANVDQQFTETEVVAGAVAEMSSTIQEVARSTSEAASVAENVGQRVVEGQKAANSTQEIIEQLSCEVSSASADIESLAAETENIGMVLDTIRGIAEQTNLLALNAAIEAARAGETGRGFAVVADEVRSLAQRTQVSTGDIQSLVERLQKEAKKAVESMKKGSESTNDCLARSAEASAAFKDSSAAVKEMTGLNLQIATAAEEQSIVADQIHGSLGNIKAISSQTSEGARDTSEANQNIASRVVDLSANLNQFQV